MGFGVRRGEYEWSLSRVTDECASCGAA